MPELVNLVFGNSRGEYRVPRHVGWGEEWCRLTDALGISERGEDMETDVFWIMPYYWGDCDCPEDAEEHLPDCLAVKDNFHYKPTGFGIQWYKYPFRDSYMNQKITLEQFSEIITACIESLEEA